MAWSPLSVPVNFVILGGQPTPGLCDVVGADDPRRIDKRQGYGLSGSFPVFLGLDLSEFKLVLRLYSQQDWDDWDVFKPIVKRPPAGKFPKALDIYHPYLDDLNIRAVMVKNRSQPEEIDGGAHSITIELIAFRRPKIALAKPDAATDKPSTDPVDQMIADAIKQINELAK